MFKNFLALGIAFFVFPASASFLFGLIGIELGFFEAFYSIVLTLAIAALLNQKMN